MEKLYEAWTQIAKIGVAKIGVEHFTSGLPMSAAARVYNLVVYLGYELPFLLRRSDGGGADGQWSGGDCVFVVFSRIKKF